LGAADEIIKIISEALLSDEAIEGVFEVLDSGSAGNDPTSSKEDWLGQIKEGITAAVAKLKEGE
jgi:hypothetical protein